MDMSDVSGERPIYLDYQATTPLDPRVLVVMEPYFGPLFGNPHSRSHRYGWDAEEAVENARGQVAAIIGAEPREVVFTSGATESNNLAIKGVARFYRKLGRTHIVTVATEHKCVLESVRDLGAEGHEVTFLPVKGDGLIDLAALGNAITDRTALVSVMAANNEIGVLQPIGEIGDLCRDRGVLFHTDAAQAVGKIRLDVEAMKIDLLSISGHKIYGPMGIGALYVRRKPRARLTPLFSGGGQERGLRSGTVPTPLAVGLGMACAIAAEEMDDESARLSALRDRLLAGLQKIDGVTVNGALSPRLPGNLNVNFEGVAAEDLMMAVPGIAVSTGSACTSASLEPSYVLRALGVEDERAHSSIRFGLGRFTTESEIDATIDAVSSAVMSLRAGGGSAAAE
jgi:cysteine desulfurase